LTRQFSESSIWKIIATAAEPGGIKLADRVMIDRGIVADFYRKTLACPPCLSLTENKTDWLAALQCQLKAAKQGFFPVTQDQISKLLALCPQNRCRCSPDHKTRHLSVKRRLWRILREVLNECLRLMSKCDKQS
jgi:hypothetical protein